MTAPKQILSEKDPDGATFWIVDLAELAEWPPTLDRDIDQFRLFVACDARELSNEELLKFAETVARQGVVYVCEWGPDCERVHDSFDEALNSSGRNDRGVVMTTWHEDENLDDALWFFVTTTHPDELYAGCQTWVAASIGSDEWTRQIEGRLSHPRALREAVLKDDA